MVPTLCDVGLHRIGEVSLSVRVDARAGPRAVALLGPVSGVVAVGAMSLTCMGVRTGSRVELQVPWRREVVGRRNARRGPPPGSQGTWVAAYSSPPVAAAASGEAVKEWIEATTGAAAEVHQSTRSLVLTACVPLPAGSVALVGASSVGGGAPITARARAAMMAPNCCVRVPAVVDHIPGPQGQHQAANIGSVLDRDELDLVRVHRNGDRREDVVLMLQHVIGDLRDPLGVQRTGAHVSLGQVVVRG